MAGRAPSQNTTAFKLGELTAEVRELIHQNNNKIQTDKIVFDKIDKRLETIETRVDGYDRLRHRGAGILVGISLAFTATGILLSSWVKDAIKSIF